MAGKMGTGAKVAIGLGVAGAALYLATKAEAKPLSPADIVISDLIIEPSEVYVGETVSISVVATNIGEIKGPYKVNCEVM